MASLPAQKPITIYQGDTFDLVLRLRAKTATGGRGSYMDLTGCVGQAEIRETTSSTTVLATFDVEVPTQEDVNLGVVSLQLTPEQTAAIAVTSAVWDFQLTFPDDSVRTVLYGPVTVWNQVTR